MKENQLQAYIPLENKEKKSVIIGAYLLWFYNVLFSFTMAVVLPSVLQFYGMMDMYAVLSGICALLSAVAIPIGGKLGDR